MSHRNVTPKKICAVIEADAAITAKVLQLANCAMFHEQDRVRSIEQALVRLGFAGRAQPGDVLGGARRLEPRGAQRRWIWTPCRRMCSAWPGSRRH